MDKTSLDDFQKVDIRIGTVVSADVPSWSHWVIRTEVDFGGEIGTKKAFSGIMKFYKPEELIGKQFPFVVNIEPKKIGPDKELSEVMMLMCVKKDDEVTPPILFRLAKKVPNGTKVG